MFENWLSRWGIVACLALSFVVRAYAQNVCIAPPALTTPVRGNMFSDEQENWLGDAISDWIEHRETLVKDTAENAYLEKIGTRLLAVLPPTGIKFRFLLVDSGEINGFSLAGGRVYVTRKLVANARNEDEVAGVLAHEIGHVITHQSAAEISDQMRRLLKVSSVGDRADIFDKFAKMVDIPDPRAGDPDSDANQAIADAVAVYAMAKAGYAPSAYPEFWDRSFFVGGKIGNGWTDFFRTTNPSQKRLRNLRAMVSALPRGCGASASSANAEFNAWKSLVIANQRSIAAASSDEGVSLNPALRSDIRRVRYSPDGKYLLAQDESSIFVLETKTPKMLFRFDAEDAKPAEWSPDSKRIVFHTGKLHVEEWDVEQQKLRTARELVTRHECLQTLLSPDGRTLMCLVVGEYAPLVGRVPYDLYLLDTESGNDIYQKKEFSYASFGALLRMIIEADSFEPVYTALSQDGNTLVVGDGVGKVAFDLRSRIEIKLGGDFKSSITGPFAFEASGIAGIDGNGGKHSGLFSFPDGKRIDATTLNVNELHSVSRGNLVTTVDKRDSKVAALDLKTQQIVVKAKSPAIDMYDQDIALQSPDGGIEFDTLNLATGQGSGRAREPLPISPLGGLRVVEISPDGKYLAMSGRSRGGVWDVATGKRIYLLRGFSGAAFHPDGFLYLDFPKFEKTDRQIVKTQLDAEHMIHIDIALKDEMRIRGGKLIEWKEAGKNKWTLLAKDVSNGAELWHRDVEGDLPSNDVNIDDGDLLLIWKVDSRGGKAELRAHPELNMQANALKDKSKGLIVERMDMQQGTIKTSALLEVPHGYEGSLWVYMVGGNVLVETHDHRTFVYSAATGAMVRQLFGSPFAADNSTGSFCLRNRRDEAVIYDGTGTETGHFQIGAPIRFVRMRENGARLLLMGADQKLRSFDLRASEK